MTVRQHDTAQSPHHRPDGRRDLRALLADAKAHYLAGRIDDAVAHYERALLLRPDNADAHSEMGMARTAAKAIPLTPRRIMNAPSP